MFYYYNFFNDNYKRIILNFIFTMGTLTLWKCIPSSILEQKYSTGVQWSQKTHLPYFTYTTLVYFEALLASNHDTYSSYLHLQCFNAVAITCFWPFILWQNWNGYSADKTNIELLEFLESFASSLGQWGSVEEAVWGWLEDGRIS